MVCKKDPFYSFKFKRKLNWYCFVLFFVFKLDILCLWKLILQVYLSKLILHNVHDVHEFSKTEKFGLFLCTHEGEQIKEL